MALTHLVDASVVKRMQDPGVRRSIESLLRAGNVGRPTICDLEIGYAARNGDEWQKLNDALAVFASVETTADHFQRALQVQRLLAERSQRGRKVPDLLVAAVAERNGLIVLHYDVDFDMIAGVTGQPTEWVVPAGTVD